jgi:microcystin-dependent protein
MTRPTLTHDGFLIPNASRVSNPRMAEPDQIDFSTVAHALWGVVEGCLVTVTTSTASTLGGLALVNGNLVKVAGGQTQGIGTGGAQDRFDIIGVNEGGTLVVIRGGEGADPVLPDVPLNVTALAAVFIPTGASSLSDNVIDKRKFVSKALLTRIASGDPLVQNLNGSGNNYLISGSGVTSWADDTWMERIAPATLRIRNNLQMSGSLTAGPISGTTGTFTGKLTAANLVQASVTPSTVGVTPGTIFQHQISGRLYVFQNGAWKELATLESAVPVGTIVTSVQPKAVMTPLGWVALDGATISEETYGALFTIPNLGTVIGTPGTRTMVLPDASRRVMITDFSLPPGTSGGRSTVTVGLLNMPAHKHNVSTQTGGGGPITLTIQSSGGHTHVVESGGAHTHWVTEHPHVHMGMNYYGNAASIISTVLGGRNKLDALFNDRNHTYSVEPLLETMPATAEVDVLSNGSAHGHVLRDAGSHSHTGTATGAPSHSHAVTEQSQGSGEPLDITPLYLSIYTYIRS